MNRFPKEKNLVVSAVALSMSFACLGLLLLAVGCGKKKATQPVTPPQKTTKLEAKKIAGTTDPAGVIDPFSSFWDIDYTEFQVTSSQGSTGQEYDSSTDGLRQYNMSGSKLGITTTVRMKAAYNDQFLYLWTSWSDPTATNDKNRQRLYYHGGDTLATPFVPNGDTFKTGGDPVPSGWSMNLNEDQFALMWDIDSAYSITGLKSGLFADSGCAIACHPGNPNAQMYPDTGHTDLWIWAAARSNPLGFALDEYCAPAPPGRVADDQQALIIPNWLGLGDTLRPLMRLDSLKWGFTTYDPLFFLMASDTIRFTYSRFNIDSGDVMYFKRGLSSSWQLKSCASASPCHNTTGFGRTPSLTTVGTSWTDSMLTRKLTQTGSMASYVDPDIDVQQARAPFLISRIHAFAGVPGFLLKPPALPQGMPQLISNPATVFNNLTGVYTLVLKRKLQTADLFGQDVQFSNLNREYPFSVAVMDADGKNHAGSPVQRLVFKP